MTIELTQLRPKKLYWILYLRKRVCTEVAFTLKRWETIRFEAAFSGKLCLHVAPTPRRVFACTAEFSEFTARFQDFPPCPFYELAVLGKIYVVTVPSQDIMCCYVSKHKSI